MGEEPGPRGRAPADRLRVALTPLEVYADGSGDARSGRPGGWAFVIIDGDVERSVGFGHALTTSCLFMELEAARAGLSEIVRRGWSGAREVVLISDSTIVLDVISGAFAPRPPRYSAAVAALREVARATQASTRWIRAHAGHRWNERVDALAAAARIGGLQSGAASTVSASPTS